MRGVHISKFGENLVKLSVLCPILRHPLRSIPPRQMSPPSVQRVATVGQKTSKSPVTELNTAGMTLFTVYCYCEQLGFNRGCLLTVDLASRLLLKRSPTVGHVEPVHRLPPGPRDPGQRGHGELGGLRNAADYRSTSSDCKSTSGGLRIIGAAVGDVQLSGGSTRGSAARDTPASVVTVSSAARIAAVPSTRPAIPRPAWLR